MAIAGKIMMRPMGEYNASTVYYNLDLVTYNNSLWICKEPNTVNVTPVEGDKWQLVVDNMSNIIIKEW